MSYNDYEVGSWIIAIRTGNDKDIVKWRDGHWHFRDEMKDEEDEIAEILKSRLGEPYEVFAPESSEWLRLQEVRRLRKSVDRLGVVKVFGTSEKFSDGFIVQLGESAEKAIAIGDGYLALVLARQLRQVSRSSHATGAVQRKKADALRNKILAAVDAKASVDDSYRILRAEIHTDHDLAIHLLREVTCKSLVIHAQSMIVARIREKEGRSVANFRRIGDMEYFPTSDLRTEQRHARALIRAGRKSGDVALVKVACDQLYRVGVILVLGWDLHMRLYKVTKVQERQELDRRMRNLMEDVGSLHYVSHGKPVHERASTELEFLSSLDMKYLEKHLGHTDKYFTPFRSLEMDGRWPE